MLLSAFSSRLRRKILYLTVLVTPMSLVTPMILSAQVEVDAGAGKLDGTSPLESGKVLMSARVGGAYAGFGDIWELRADFAYIIAKFSLGGPVEANLGLGAGGDLVFFEGKTDWSAGAFGAIHLFLTRHVGFYFQLGGGYGATSYGGARGFMVRPSGGAELFLVDAFGIFIGSDQNSLGLGIRIAL